MTNAFDVIIIGGGPAGYVGAIRASQLGMRVALVEREKLGGVCLHVGCIPTKVFLHTAELLEKARGAREFGVRVGPVELDIAQVHKRKERVVTTQHKGVEYLMRKHQVPVFTGHGRLLGRTRVGVSLADGSETELAGKHIVLATGSRPRGLPGMDIDHDRVIDSTGALALQKGPESIAILGAGAVGVEFASIYSAFGARVTLIELLPTILPMEDDEVSAVLHRALQRRGVKIMTGTTVRGLEKTGQGVRLRVGPTGAPAGDGKDEQVVEVEYLLMAVGRAGNTEELGLEEAEVEVGKGFVPVGPDMRTSAPNVFAVGDLNGGYLLAHVASEEAVLAVETIAGEEARPLDYNAVPRCTYSIPEVASFGLTEKQAREQGREVKVGKFPFMPNGKAVIRGEREGLVKVVTDARVGEILGVHMVGPSVTELLAETVGARWAEATILEVATSMHAHPTLSEVVREAALDALGRAIHG